MYSAHDAWKKHFCSYFHHIAYAICMVSFVDSLKNYLVMTF